MHLLTHRCPECNFSALAPVAAIAEGDAGIWQCEGCNQAFSIQVAFRQLDPELLSRRRRERQAEPLRGGEPPELAEPTDPDAARAEHIQHRLWEIQAETQRLESLLEELEEEAQRLETEKSHL